VARILIVAGGCRGRQLASALSSEGHVVRVSTRTEAGRAAIERAGAECFIGDPDRLVTMRSSLEHVAVVCWLMAGAKGSAERLRALHCSRLEQFLGQAIDTTVRGFLYEAAGTSVPSGVLAEGREIVSSLARRNAIPVGFLDADPLDGAGWQTQAREAVEWLLAAR
jgi:hypothetical protein